MHIVIAAITALAGLVWALNSLQNSGFNLNSLNPFAWARRRRWAKLYGTRPLYNLAKPMEAAAAIVVGLLKQEGEVSREQKQVVIDLFRSSFNLDGQGAVELFASSAHLVKDEVSFELSIKNILNPSSPKFTPDMVSSFIAILDEVASLEGPPSRAQCAIIERVKDEFKIMGISDSKWG